jgi:hypothetical protein
VFFKKLKELCEEYQVKLLSSYEDFDHVIVKFEEENDLSGVYYLNDDCDIVHTSGGPVSDVLDHKMKLQSSVESELAECKRLLKACLDAEGVIGPDDDDAQWVYIENMISQDTYNQIVGILKDDKLV